MIEKFCLAVVEDLGATGVLVLGIGFFLYRTSKELGKHLFNLNTTLRHINTNIEVLYYLIKDIAKKEGTLENDKVKRPTF